MNITAPWQKVNVQAALDPKLGVVRPRKKIPAHAYLREGMTPVVDQGRRRIAGWTNDEEAVIRQPLPVIVFGDHTRTFKYVDFPFAAGADGTLILKPSAEFDPRFFYYACLELDLPSRGYNRHFAALKERDIPRPPLFEQRFIASALAAVDAAVEVEGDLLRTARELKQAALAEVFTRGVPDFRRGETAAKDNQARWPLVPLGSLATIGNGSTPRRSDPRYWTEGSIPWLTSGKIHEQVIRYADEFVTREAVKECHLPIVAGGSLLVAITGQGKTLGNVAITEIETCISQHLAYIAFLDDAGDPDFFRYFLSSRYDDLRRAAHGMGSTKGALTCAFLKTYPVPNPEPAVQRKIAAIFQALDARIARHEARRRVLRELFASLLHDLMSGRRRVAVESKKAPDRKSVV